VAPTRRNSRKTGKTTGISSISSSQLPVLVETRRKSKYLRANSRRQRTGVFGPNREINSANREITGTFTVNTDCTGAATLVTADGTSLKPTQIAALTTAQAQVLSGAQIAAFDALIG